jgi:hypothetical protein
MRTSQQTKPTDWTDPKWSLPNVHVSGSWGPDSEGK